MKTKLLKIESTDQECKHIVYIDATGSKLAKIYGDGVSVSFYPGEITVTDLKRVILISENFNLFFEN